MVQRHGYVQRLGLIFDSVLLAVLGETKEYIIYKYKSFAKS